jgi:hypothetical protein
LQLFLLNTRKALVHPDLIGAVGPTSKAAKKFAAFFY